MNFKLLSLAVVGTIGAVTAVIYISRDAVALTPAPQPPLPVPPPAPPVVDQPDSTPAAETAASEPAAPALSQSQLRARTAKARRDQRFIVAVLERAKRKGFVQTHETPLGVATITELSELLDEIDGKRASSLDEDERRARITALLNPPRTTH